MIGAPYIFSPISGSPQSFEGGFGKPLQTLQDKTEQLKPNYFKSLIAILNPNKTLTQTLHVRFCYLLNSLHIDYKKPLKINDVRKRLENVRVFSNTYPHLKSLKNKELPMLSKAVLGRLGFSEAPPTILQYKDTSTEEWKRECLAWSLLKRRDRDEIKIFLDKAKATHGEAFYNDLRDRLNNLRIIVKARREEKTKAAQS